MSKPYIKLTTCDGGDWEILEVNLGEDFHASGHRLSSDDWIELLSLLGFEVETECVTDEEMEMLG